MTREELEAKIAELQAEIAAMDAEPDYEAWRPFLIHTGWDIGLAPFTETDKEKVIEYIAALPFAPIAPVRERRCPACKVKYQEVVDVDAHLADLARVPAARTWPSEAELDAMIGKSFVLTAPVDSMKRLARRLREHMTGGAK